jgi:hypothetical protein
MEVTDVFRFDRRIILRPKDFARMELVDHPFEKMLAGSADFFAFSVTVIDFFG